MANTAVWQIFCEKLHQPFNQMGIKNSIQADLPSKKGIRSISVVSELLLKIQAQVVIF
jgi:hypothetical protein